MFAGLAGVCLSLAGLAHAAPPAPATPTDISVPMFAASSADPYSLNVAPAQNGPPGTVAVTQSAPAPKYSFDELLQNVHGYVSTGVSSRGGYGADGALLIPLVPGKAELEVGGGTGQTGAVFPRGPGLKRASATTTGYEVGLHVQPSDNLDIFVGYSNLNVKLPQLPARW